MSRDMNSNFTSTMLDGKLACQRTNRKRKRPRSRRAPLKQCVSRIELISVAAAETYEVFVTRQAPRFLVKEKFPNGSVTELVELTNSASDMPD